MTPNPNPNAVPYQTKSGATQYMPKRATLELYSAEYMGYCLACGNEQEGVEPDARKYTCEECGRPKVYGGEELILMDLVA